MTAKIPNEMDAGLRMRRGIDGRWENDDLVLTDHPIARGQAVARQVLSVGTIIVAIPALCTVLLPEEKGLRCDSCFRRSPENMKKCTGCAEYWYCGRSCQNRHWRSVHKRMCKYLPAFRASREMQSAAPHRWMDAILLSHLVSEHAERLMKAGMPVEDLADNLATYLSLIPFHTDERHPPVCVGPPSNSLPYDVLDALYSRFSNNNFIVHSHLNSIGHGIFPLGSRLFNHSCMPNAIVTYDFADTSVFMKVRALKEICENEEITIPYFDPALPYRQRQEISRYSYGFECACPVCILESSIDTIPDPPNDDSGRQRIENALLAYVFPRAEPSWPSINLLLELPSSIHCVLHERFLQGLSAAFRDAAHDGPYDIALRTGTILLALYLVRYPRFYPQTGMHCLELAKTSWNASVKRIEAIQSDDLLASSRIFLRMTVESLVILNEEGDAEDSPLKEASVLEELLN